MYTYLFILSDNYPIEEHAQTKIPTNISIDATETPTAMNLPQASLPVSTVRLHRTMLTFSGL